MVRKKRWGTLVLKAKAFWVTLLGFLAVMKQFSPGACVVVLELTGVALGFGLGAAGLGFWAVQHHCAL